MVGESFVLTNVIKVTGGGKFVLRFVVKYYLVSPYYSEFIRSQLTDR